MSTPKKWRAKKGPLASVTFACDVCGRDIGGADVGDDVNLLWFTGENYRAVHHFYVACNGEHRCSGRLTKRHRDLHLHDLPIPWFWGDATWFRLLELFQRFEWPDANVRARFARFFCDVARYSRHVPADDCVCGQHNRCS